MKNWRHAPVVAVLSLVAMTIGATAGPVPAQTDSTSSTTASTVGLPITTTPTTGATTTTAPAAPTSTEAPAGPPTTLPPETVPPPMPQSSIPAPPAAPEPVEITGEDGSEEPPPAAVAVPPRSVPRAATPVDEAVAKVVDEQLRLARQAASVAAAESRAADLVLAKVVAEQASVQRAFEGLQANDTDAAQRLVSLRRAMRARAVALYISGPGEPVISLGDDIQEYGRRQVLVEAMHAVDRRLLRQYLGAKKAAGGEVATLVDLLEDVNGRVVAAQADAAVKMATVQRGLQGIGTATAVGPVGASGFAFPVALPHNFISSFGFPRSGGRLHQGNDLFAPYGTPLFAAERGVVGKVGTNSLGGIKLWISGASGTSYYYAHLSAFALGIADGTVVDPGDIVGFVGNTGNAISTPPHLHFEIHPGGGDAIDPYPILHAADVATRTALAQRPAANP